MFEKSGIGRMELCVKNGNLAALNEDVGFSGGRRNVPRTGFSPPSTKLLGFGRMEKRAQGRNLAALNPTYEKGSRYLAKFGRGEAPKLVTV